jgi:hypothetical protein
MLENLTIPGNKSMAFQLAKVRAADFVTRKISFASSVDVGFIHWLPADMVGVFTNLQIVPVRFEYNTPTAIQLESAAE